MKPKTQSVNRRLKSTAKSPQFRVLPKCERPPLVSNTVEYRAVNGRHIVTLNLGEGVFSAVRAVAHAQQKPSPQAYILDTVCSDAAQMLAQLTDAETAAFVKWQGGQESSAQAPTAEREITLRLSEKAYAILAGRALSGHYDSAEHWILATMSGLCAQCSGRDEDEKEYAKMFGLKVEANGNTRLP